MAMGRPPRWTPRDSTTPLHRAATLPSSTSARLPTLTRALNARRILEIGCGLGAAAGQVLVSNVVRELAAGKGILFADIGEVVPKGFEEPVRLYEVLWRQEA